MTEDMEEVLDVMKMDAKPQWDNKDDKKKKESLSKYYKQLTKQQIEDIQLLYNYDFQLFDYKKTFPLWSSILYYKYNMVQVNICPPD